MFMADYCLKKTADDNIPCASEDTLNDVRNSFYVDNGLVSSKTVCEGKKKISELQLLLAGI